MEQCPARDARFGSAPVVVSFILPRLEEAAPLRATLASPRLGLVWDARLAVRLIALAPGWVLLGLLLAWWDESWVQAV